jgi:perosamine synthetase
MIPLLSPMIPLLKPTLKTDAILKSIERVLDSNFIAEGPIAAEFEQGLSEFLGRDVAVMNSCTSAMTIAATMIGIQPGDEVISTPMTCIATNSPFVLAGATIRWADIDPNTGNIAASSVHRLITPNTKCIVCVWWSGMPPSDFDELRNICDYYKIPLVIDAAHAIDSRFDGVPVARCGDYVCFSFQAVKHLTTGDGGALACQDIERARRLRWFGVDRKLPGRFEQDIPEVGYKFHMNDISAAIGLTMLPLLPVILASHRKMTRLYDNLISNPKITKLARSPKADSSCWVYSMRVQDREEFSIYMEDNGVQTGRLHVRNDTYSCFSQFRAEQLPGVDVFDRELIHIPAGPHLTNMDTKKIIDLVNDF